MRATLVKKILFVFQEKYLEYFAWKQNYVLYEEHAYCQLCQMLNDKNLPSKNYKDLRKWWMYDENQNNFCTDGKSRKYYKSMMMS